MDETISFFSDFCSAMICLAGILTVFFVIVYGLMGW